MVCLAPCAAKSVCVNSREILFIIKTSSHSLQPVPVSSDCRGDRTSHLETGRSLLKGNTAALKRESKIYTWCMGYMLLCLRRDREGQGEMEKEREEEEEESRKKSRGTEQSQNRERPRQRLVAGGRQTKAVPGAYH